MFRTQLYNPLKDPQRLEYYNESSLIKDGYYVLVNQKKYFSPGTKLWNIYKSNVWHSIKSILCRFLMIFYSFFLILETYEFFNEKIILLNLAYSILILVDCVIVLFVRKGLEDRWCSLSILFFICANTTPLWMLEIFYDSLLSANIFHSDFTLHIESHYKQFNNSLLKQAMLKNGTVIDSDKPWSDALNKEIYYNKIGRYETLFCISLILSRLFIPQATLTWSAISTMCEFSFNTIFDVYTTMSLCRDPKLNLSQNFIISCFIVSNGALLSISLNLFTESDNESTESDLKISLLRQITDNLYFRLIIQVLFADLPFLILRLLIITKWQTIIKPDMYYLIAKQIIIIVCKLIFMIYNSCKEFLKDHNFDELNQLNKSMAFF